MLSGSQRREFKRNGFVTIRDAVDNEITESALETVWEGLPVDRDDPESWKGRNRGSDIPDVPSFEPFERIAREVFPYAESLVGDGALAPPSEPPLENCHHAGTLVGEAHDGILSPHINYPREETDWQARATENQGSHVDGYAPTDRFGEDVNYLPLTIGAAVYFDEVKPGGGGFTVWPGSHLKTAEYFSSHTYAEYIEEQDVLDDLDLGPPFEIAGESGDLTLWHHNLVHTAGPNLGERIRMAAIGRYIHADILEVMGEDFPNTGDGLGDPWSQYPELQESSGPA